MGALASKLSLARVPISSTMVHTGWREEQSQPPAAKPFTLSETTLGARWKDLQDQQQQEWKKLSLAVRTDNWWKEGNENKHQDNKENPNLSPVLESITMPVSGPLTTFGFRSNAMRQHQTTPKYGFIFYPGGRHSDRESGIIKVEIPSDATMVQHWLGGFVLNKWIPREWAELPSNFQSGFYNYQKNPVLSWNAGAKTIFDTDVIGIDRLCTGQVRFSEGRTQRIMTDGALAWESAEQAIQEGVRQRDGQWYRSRS